eukprot:CAMPEP_0195059332 /NCGR_PEP_ID=MMETSP0448-20130528/6852_1 /TAXON_ID=66468 /ORGANISM="Heterocapsa triquestra, Strain CCMP 448" /LENGTH=260 /DNA_ID=CAMNT_0040089589 /DNA_START=79 /DNA_END=862 /DNA_ORIENTATION=+
MWGGGASPPLRNVFAAHLAVWMFRGDCVKQTHQKACVKGARAQVSVETLPHTVQHPDSGSDVGVGVQGDEDFDKLTTAATPCQTHTWYGDPAVQRVWHMGRIPQASVRLCRRPCHLCLLPDVPERLGETSLLQLQLLELPLQPVVLRPLGLTEQPPVILNDVPEGSQAGLRGSTRSRGLVVLVREVDRPLRLLGRSRPDDADAVIVTVSIEVGEAVPVGGDGARSLMSGAPENVDDAMFAGAGALPPQLHRHRAWSQAAV